MLEDLKNFDSLQNIIDTKYQSLDSSVLTFRIWIFCENAYIYLFNEIHTLLQKRYCVHMKEVSFAERGIPQNGKYYSSSFIDISVIPVERVAGQ